MSNRAKILIISGVVVLLIVLLYFFGMKRSNPEDDKFVTDQWDKTYDPMDKGPYGTYVLKELLDTVGLFGNFITLYEGLENDLEDHPKVNDIYFFVGPKNHMPDSSAAYLMDFVKAGNTAFLATTKFPDELEYKLFYNSYDIFNENVFDTTQYLKFEHPDLSAKRYKFRYIYNNKPDTKAWKSFNPNNFEYIEGELDEEYVEDVEIYGDEEVIIEEQCDYPEDFEDTLDAEIYEEAGPIVLGTNTKGEWNYVKIKYGKGYFFLHSIPYCFTNISMLKRDGFIYAEHMLEHIPPGRVQWDRYNLRRHLNSSSGGPNSSKGSGERRESMLQFIMAHPPLVWAMVILILGAILYALFKGKRKQRIIPATEQKENTSLEYVNTLSSLYMQQGSHAKLINLKERTFMNFIAERYFIMTSKADDRYIEKVAIKSQVEKEKIKEIFDIFNRLNGAANVSDDNLIVLHKKIEYFYKKCR